MKILILLIVTIFYSFSGYCQPATGLSKEDAIHLARETAESSSPSMSSSHMKAKAIFLGNENSWIIDFSDESSSSGADSDYMLRVEATSGKGPELLRGSQKQRYKPYFESVN